MLLGLRVGLSLEPNIWCWCYMVLQGPLSPDSWVALLTWRHAPGWVDAITFAAFTNCQGAQ